MRKTLCPRCRNNRRAWEDIPESARWEQKRLAKFCESCFEAQGYVKRTLLVKLKDGPYRAEWWELPAVADDISIDELFEMAGRSVEAKRKR